MSKLKSFMLATLALTAGCAGSTSYAETSLDVDPLRLVKIEGEVNAGIMDQAEQLTKLATVSKDPVYVLINSAGGGVYEGLQFVDAIKAVQARGVVVKCFVPNIAMSMAFVIYTQCNERYAMKYSLLLFHPMRATLMGAYRADELGDLSSSLRMLEEPLVAEMIARTRIPRAEFMRNYQAETIWTAEMLLARSPGFLRVVTDFGAATFVEATE